MGITHKIGNFYMLDGGLTINDVYILSVVDKKRGNDAVALVGLGTGNRWTDPVGVDYYLNITEDEWRDITASKHPFLFDMVFNKIDNEAVATLLTL